jgi:hypothetical protein
VGGSGYVLNSQHGGAIQMKLMLFLEYAKDLRIIALRRKGLPYKRRASSALGGQTSGPT